MRHRIYLVIFLVCTVFPLTGCNAGEGNSSGGAQTVSTVHCEVFYRAEPGNALSPAPMITFQGGSDQKYLAFDDMTFNARFQDDEFEGRALYIAITGSDEVTEISRQLYQFDAENPPRNQFVGGHGFTGLQYVFSPSSLGEMQYFCSIE